MFDACPVHPKGTMVIPMPWRIMIRLKPLPTSNIIHRRREPQSQHGASPDDSFGPLTGPSIPTNPVITVLRPM